MNQSIDYVSVDGLLLLGSFMASFSGVYAAGSSADNVLYLHILSEGLELLLPSAPVQILHVLEITLRVLFEINYA